MGKCVICSNPLDTEIIIAFIDRQAHSCCEKCSGTYAVDDYLNKLFEDKETNEEYVERII
jgi:hypothetical protein